MIEALKNHHDELVTVLLEKLVPQNDFLRD